MILPFWCSHDKSGFNMTKRKSLDEAIVVPSSLKDLGEVAVEYDSDDLTRSSNSNDDQRRKTRSQASKGTEDQGRHGGRKRRRKKSGKGDSKIRLPESARRALLAHLRTANVDAETLAHKKTANADHDPSITTPVITALNETLTKSLNNHYASAISSANTDSNTNPSITNKTPYEGTSDLNKAKAGSESDLDHYQSLISTVALSLVRSGAVEPNFGSLMTAIVERAVGHVALRAQDGQKDGHRDSEGDTDGYNPHSDDDDDDDESSDDDKDQPEEDNRRTDDFDVTTNYDIPDIRVPPAVVDAGIKVMMESMRGKDVVVVGEEE